MKLNGPQIETIESQTGFKPIPDAHPVIEDLMKVYGEHTFYVDTGGLFVWESVENSDAEGEDLVVAVKIAAWSDKTRSSLSPHEPQMTEVLVELVVPS